MISDKPLTPIHSLWAPILSFALDRVVDQLSSSCCLSSKLRQLNRHVANDIKEQFERDRIFLLRELQNDFPTSIGSVSQLCDFAVWMLASCLPNEKAGWIADILGKSERITRLWAECVLLAIKLIDIRTCSMARRQTTALDDLVEGLCIIIHSKYGRRLTSAIFS